MIGGELGECSDPESLRIPSQCSASYKKWRGLAKCIDVFDQVHHDLYKEYRGMWFSCTNEGKNYFITTTPEEGERACVELGAKLRNILIRKIGCYPPIGRI